MRDHPPAAPLLGQHLPTRAPRLPRGFLGTPAPDLQQSNASSPANKRQRTDQGFEVAHNPGAPAWAGTLEQTGLAAVAGGSQQGATPPSLVPLLQGPNPRSPAAATAAAAAAAAAAALRPLAAREQAIPRQVPATLRRDLLQQSLQHPLAAVDRLLTNAT